MSPKHALTNEKLYQIALENAAQSTARELAHRLGMKEPNFIAAIAKYAAETRKPLPKLAFEKAKTTVKTIRRTRKDMDIRISGLRLDNAGLGNALAFKVIADPDNQPPRLIIVEDTTAPKALRVTMVPAAKAEPKAKKETLKIETVDFSAAEGETLPQVIRRRGRPKKVVAAV